MAKSNVQLEAFFTCNNVAVHNVIEFFFYVMLDHRKGVERLLKSMTALGSPTCAGQYNTGVTQASEIIVQILTGKCYPQEL